MSAASVAQVRRRIEDGIAILEIDHPPVNAISQPVRAALQIGLQEAQADPAVRAIVIHGAGRIFVAGADLHEMELPPREPLLNDVLRQLEACSKPVIAALHGAVLGGGLELALASHYRCATADVSIGFPEIKLGLLPGSGGTQRLPRLLGAEVALEMMLGGAPIEVERAEKLGLVDRVLTQPDALSGALLFARERRARATTAAVRPLGRSHCAGSGPVRYTARPQRQGIRRTARAQGPRDWTPAPLLRDLAECDSSFAAWDRQRPGAHNLN